LLFRIAEFRLLTLDIPLQFFDGKRYISQMVHNEVRHILKAKKSLKLTPNKRLLLLIVFSGITALTKRKTIRLQCSKTRVAKQYAHRVP
jgi:hypothetical protein